MLKSFALKTVISTHSITIAASHTSIIESVFTQGINLHSENHLHSCYQSSLIEEMRENFKSESNKPFEYR